jgi:acetylornithine/succinyldiaminopimelate/putrescine aminotransferase
VPVFLVVGDPQGGLTANYHGTTLLTQLMRGMWPELRDGASGGELFQIEPVAVNDVGSLRRAVERYDRGRYKVAGFLHEIVLMNYGAIRLDEEYLRKAYETCEAHDIPTLVDEIQTCSWSPEVFLFREYGLHPSFVAIGKGMPGGNSPASRIITTAAMDNLDQFGALVTNGQEELAALSYLVTIEFVQSNAGYIEFVGDYYQCCLSALAARYPRLVREVHGMRHLASLYFHDHESCNAFVRRLNEQCIDISAQSYKVESPPTALTKLPVIASVQMVDFLIGKMEGVLASL